MGISQSTTTSTANPRHQSKDLTAEANRRLKVISASTDNYSKPGKVAEIEEWISFLRDGMLLISDSEKAAFVYHLTSALEYHFKCTNQAASIEEAISVQRMYLSGLSHGDVESDTGQPHLEQLLVTRVMVLDSNDLQSSISLDEEVVILRERVVAFQADGNDDGSIFMTFCLCKVLRARFRSGTNLADANDAIDMITKVTAETDQCNPPLHMWLDLLVDLHHGRYKITRQSPDLDAAISTERRILALQQPGSDENRVFPLIALLRTRFDHSQNPEDGQELTAEMIKLVSHLPHGHPLLRFTLSNISDTFYECYKLNDAPSDLDNAISYRERSLEYEPSSEEQDIPLADTLLILSGYCLTRYKQRRDVADLLQGIAHARRAIEVQNVADTAVEIAESLSMISDWLQCEFTETKNPKNLHEAIIAIQDAIILNPDDVHYRLSHANCLVLLEEHTSEEGHTSEAIQLLKETLQNVSSDHFLFQKLIQTLGRAYMARYHHTREISDIHDATSSFQKACLATVSDDQDLCVSYTMLGRALAIRYYSTRSPDDLQAALTAHRKAVALSKNNEMPLQIDCLDQLAQSLFVEFDRTEASGLLEEVAQHRKEIIRLTAPEDEHTKLPTRLERLADIMVCQVWDLAPEAQYEYNCKAVEMYQRAVSLAAPDRHPELPNLMFSLARAQERGYAISGRREDLEAAIATQERLMALVVREGLPATRTALWRKNLGDGYLLLDNGNDGLELWRQAVEQYRLAATDEESDHKARFDTALAWIRIATAPLVPEELVAKLKSYIAELLSLDFDHLEPTAADKISQEFKGVLDELSRDGESHKALKNFGFPGSLPEMVSALSALVKTQETFLQQALEACQCAIELVPQVAGMDHTLETRYRIILRSSKLAAEAAALAFRAGRTDKALEWLENGRCLVWSQLSELRTPLHGLRQYDARLAEEMEVVSDTLERFSSRMDGFAMGEPGDGTGRGRESAGFLRTLVPEDDKQHVQALKKWNELLGQVRSLPGFENFLRPPRCSDIMRHLPEGGSVVMVNVDERRCDAMALLEGHDQPLHIPLPNLSLPLVKTLAADLEDAMLSSGIRHDAAADLHRLQARRVKTVVTPKRDRQMAKIMEELWKRVVNPVLVALGIRASSTPIPGTRIWWVVTGPLAFLPIHAAGIYGRGPEATCLSDYVVSSYLPTISALAGATATGEQHPAATAGLLLISVPEAPDLQRIPGTKDEVEAIGELARSHDIPFKTLQGECATVSNGIKGMQEYSCVHFACHATQDKEDRLKSGFFLQDGRLDLSQIIQSERSQQAGEQAAKAELAFLSACQTSKGDESLPEEAVHIAAGMLAAGYSGVVATMWSITDVHAPEVSRDFYRHLLKDGRLDASKAAKALQFATQRLKDRLDDTTDGSFMKWVPYVHYGI